MIHFYISIQVICILSSFFHSIFYLHCLKILLLLKCPTSTSPYDEYKLLKIELWMMQTFYLKVSPPQLPDSIRDR